MNTLLLGSVHAPSKYREYIDYIQKLQREGTVYNKKTVDELIERFIEVVDDNYHIKEAYTRKKGGMNIMESDKISAIIVEMQKSAKECTDTDSAVGHSIIDMGEMGNGMEDGFTAGDEKSKTLLCDSEAQSITNPLSNEDISCTSVNNTSNTKVYPSTPSSENASITESVSSELCDRTVQIDSNVLEIEQSKVSDNISAVSNQRDEFTDNPIGITESPDSSVHSPLYTSSIPVTANTSNTVHPHITAPHNITEIQQARRHGVSGNLLNQQLILREEISAISAYAISVLLICAQMEDLLLGQEIPERK
ncbi:uncharacterized protein NEPG_01465 [Nematocida parisii ERTm1]|uniref:uncharacterized protein n=1 Tax=Nematocida parisii (strain ERTm1 / ATCC PRA-289) TaxID=881290 RepID=UPI000264BA1D|nr:uncharacterized protein NEPG_01465 [Nematocida parisii ERTm1]EIJ93893.1 hypothetical protein NEPG_01465 [Nematocida parisii ERTm1]|eukprot:XP_013059293.1 hypothetical protein NEPG_01465 [Nematocida parisii ERTm1]